MRSTQRFSITLPNEMADAAQAVGVGRVKSRLSAVHKKTTAKA